MELNYPENDNEYQEHIIEEVTHHSNDGGWMIKFNGSTCIGISEGDIIPFPGQTVRLYGKGFGFETRGLFIEGEKVYYRTPTQQETHHQDWVNKRNEDMQQEADLKRGERDARRALLPDEFQKRIARLERNNPVFDRDFESYELMVCEEAVKLASHFKTSAALKEWNDKPSLKQEKEYQADKNHSGNSWAMAVRLAYLYMDSPEYVEFFHGALCTLVGCSDYGCFASEPDEQRQQSLQEAGIFLPKTTTSTN